MTAVIYDQIGKTYDQTRKADPQIVETIIHYLRPSVSGSYLEVGCGSGNYTHAVSEKGYRICGIDISEEMLGKARKKNPSIEWVLGDARKLPYQNGNFDGATCVLASHHIKDIEKCYQEVYRVINKGSFVIFTSFPEQVYTWWLNKYFPKVMHKSAQMMHRENEIYAALEKAGFREIKTEKFFISENTQDLFMHAGKYRPHIYLDPIVRAGISTFALADCQDEIAEGCNKLQDDMASGAIDEIIEAHENDIGDYAFVVGEKR